MTHAFCGDCNRLRLMADGNLKVMLLTAICLPVATGRPVLSVFSDTIYHCHHSSFMVAVFTSRDVFLAGRQSGCACTGCSGSFFEWLLGCLSAGVFVWRQ